MVAWHAVWKTRFRWFPSINIKETDTTCQAFDQPEDGESPKRKCWTKIAQAWPVSPLFYHSDDAPLLKIIEDIFYPTGTPLVWFSTLSQGKFSYFEFRIKGMTEIWQLAVVSGLLKLFLRFIKVQAFQVYLKHSWKKCFCLREPVFWGRIFLILRRNFPNME